MEFHIQIPSDCSENGKKCLRGFWRTVEKEKTLKDEGCLQVAVMT